MLLSDLARAGCVYAYGRMRDVPSAAGDAAPAPAAQAR